MKAAYFFLFCGFALLGGAIFWGGKLAAALPHKISSSALEVDALPISQVLLDGKELGKTPFEKEDLSPGEYTLRLLPETTASFSAWERKIKLNPHLLTYVNYIFASTEKESAGEILTLEKISQGKGELVVLSDPDGASFSLDGQDQGSTPKALEGFETGEHEISFSSPGYLGRSLKIKTWAGHKLLVNVKLAGQSEKTPLATKSAGPRVKILETPTGWLRIRAEPSLISSEAAQVKPGEEFTLLDQKDGWFKIQYGQGSQGWVWSQYAQKIASDTSQIRK